MALYHLDNGFTPLASMAVGGLASVLPVQRVVVLVGMCSLALALYAFFAYADVRRMAEGQSESARNKACDTWTSPAHPATMLPGHDPPSMAWCAPQPPALTRVEAEQKGAIKHGFEGARERILPWNGWRVVRIGFPSWRTVRPLFSSCLALLGALDRIHRNLFVPLPVHSMIKFFCS